MELNALIDGGSRGNPGPSGVGVVLRQGREVIARHKEFIGTATNNEAEYRGLIAALTLARERGAKSLQVYSDSKLIVNQMSGEWKLANERLKSLHDAARYLASGLTHFQIDYIPREHNTEADALANAAMDEAATSNPVEVGGECSRSHERIRYFGKNCPLCSLANLLERHLKTLITLTDQVSVFNSGLGEIFQEKPATPSGQLLVFPLKVQHGHEPEGCTSA